MIRPAPNAGRLLLRQQVRTVSASSRFPWTVHGVWLLGKTLFAMKLIRFGEAGAERPGLLLPGGGRVVVPDFCQDYNERFFNADGMEQLGQWAAGDLSGAETVPEAARWAAAVARPSKIVCVGLNYRAHALETGAEIPGEPVLFMKASSAWSGPFDNVLLPPGSQKLDWEVELAVVIGKTMRRVPKAAALDHVAGYAVMNDYSERSWQKERGGQWSKGKSGDTFAPFGPWLATPDELPGGDPGNLALGLKLNGQTKQNSSTADLIFGVAEVLSYISQFMTLLPGDVVSTGTPSGVGAGHRPEIYLKAGDIVEATVAGLGTQWQRVVALESKGMTQSADFAKSKALFLPSQKCPEEMPMPNTHLRMNLSPAAQSKTTEASAVPKLGCRHFLQS